MARRSKKCSNPEFSTLINSDSESLHFENTQALTTHREEITGNIARSSLRIKLRRSTSESMYKIDRRSKDNIHAVNVPNTMSKTEENKNLEFTSKRSERLQYKCLQNQIEKRNFSPVMKTDDTKDNKASITVTYDTPVETTKRDSFGKNTKLKEGENRINQGCYEMTDFNKSISNKHNIRDKNLFNIRSVSKGNKVYQELPISCCSTKQELTTPERQSNIETSFMEKRNVDIKKPATPLQEARTYLHVNYVPKSLPCREIEFNDIFSFLEKKLIDKTGGCIYISGVPGTGKTATVNEVVKCLKKFVRKGVLDDFNYVEINGMKLSEPRQIYVEMLKKLSGHVIPWEQAYQTLEKMFNNTSRKHASTNLPMTLLLVDELDLLCTKRQDVVYNILDWPTKLSAHLVVITIANTMDLPERLLMGRVTSRLGLTRLTFQPYTYKQLQEIVSTRLKSNSANSFKSEAIQLVARKVSAVSGDARRALDICRRATEIAETYGSNMVLIQHVNEALSEMIATAKVQAIKHCSNMEKIFLQAVCAEITRIGIEETCFKNVYIQFESLCSFDGIQVPTITESLAICARLGTMRLLICEHSKSDIHQRILLNVSGDDIHYALQKMDFVLQA